MTTTSSNDVANANSAPDITPGAITGSVMRKNVVNGFAPSESSDVVAEFKIDSTRLPHGAQLWRLNSEGIETLIALFALAFAFAFGAAQAAKHEAPKGDAPKAAAPAKAEAKKDAKDAKKEVKKKEVKKKDEKKDAKKADAKKDDAKKNDKAKK